MLEKVDFKVKDVSKDEYKPTHDHLIERLVVLQQQAHSAGVGVVVVFEGWNGAGKGSRISDLMYNLDARATSVYVGTDLDPDAEKGFVGRKFDVTGYYPVMQDFWKALGERNSITFYDRGWYSAALQHMLYSSYEKLLLPQQSERHYLDSIHDFERQLVADGYVVIKFFVHMSKKGQVERLERLHDDPATRWRVSNRKLKSVGNYDDAYKLYDRLLEKSNFDFAPWTLINGEDKRRANLIIAQTLVDAIEGALAVKEEGGSLVLIEPEEEQAAETADKTVVAEVDTAAKEEVSDEETEADANSTADSAPYDAPATDEADDEDLSVPQTLVGADQLEADAKAVEASEAVLGTPKPGRGMLSGVKLARAQAAATRASALAPRASRYKIVKDYPRVDAVDHTLKLDPQEYKAQLKELQKKLFRLENEMYQKRIPLMIMYEGWDAAGKGGNIKRIAQALDARAYTIFPSPAPTKPELAHPFLWRYWTRLPKAGHVGMYDRSWYGRVLVERVEGLAKVEEWARAYDEINEFEHDMIAWGAILLKFWVDVSPEEQLNRFQQREQDPTKQWKITEDDWRNREKYPQYKAAIDDMFRLTSTKFAPWIVLESDDKRYARIKALRIVVEALEERLHGKSS